MTVSIPNAKLRTRRKWLLGGLLAWGALGFLPAMTALLVALASNPLFVFFVVAYFAGILGFDRASRRWLKPRTGELRVDETGLFLAGRRLVKRSDLTHGHVVREGEQMLLRLVLRGVNAQPIDIEIADEAQAQELLAAMYLDRTVAQYTMFASHVKRALLHGAYLGGASILFALSGLVLMDLFGSHVPHGWRAMASIIPALVWALGMSGAVLGVLAGELFISVGADGVWIRRPFVQKRFVSFSELRTAEHAGRNVTLTLADGTTVELHHRRQSEEEAKNLVARVRAGIEAFQAAPEHAGEVVARNGRSVAEWIASANRHHERSASYRQAVVPQDQLWRIVEDAAADPTERAGAALALRANLTAEGRARLGVAAGACAEQRLRVALEAVVTPDDEALLAALEPLEEPMRRRRSMR